MKSLVIGLLLVLTLCSQAFCLPGGQTSAGTNGGGISMVQGTVPDPAKSQVTSAMTGTVVFYFPVAGATGQVNIAGWYNIHLYSVADTTYYYNSDTTKTFICPATLFCDIFVAQPNVLSVTVVFGAGANYVQGM